MTPQISAVIALALIPLGACAQVDQGPPNADFEPAFAAQTRAPALDGGELGKISSIEWIASISLNDGLVPPELDMQRHSHVPAR